jgi:stress-induced morphogen
LCSGLINIWGKNNMPMTAEEITRRIQTAIPDAEIHLEDLAGDNDHWKVTVTSAAFAGQSRVAQHRMVNAAFGADLGTTLHALAVNTIAR